MPNYDASRPGAKTVLYQDDATGLWKHGELAENPTSSWLRLFSDALFYTEKCVVKCDGGSYSKSIPAYKIVCGLFSRRPRPDVPPPRGFGSDTQPLGNCDFKAYTPARAFLLNSLVVAFAIAFGTEIRRYAEAPSASGSGFGVTFGASLGVGFAVYLLFWLIYGYGGGMVAARPPMFIHPDTALELFGVHQEPHKMLMLQLHNTVTKPRVHTFSASMVTCWWTPSANRKLIM